MARKAEKALTSDDLTFVRTEKQPLRNTDSSELLCGREPQYPVVNVEGWPVALEATLERHGPDRFELRYRLGPNWYTAQTIQPDDPHFEILRSRFDSKRAA